MRFCTVILYNQPFDYLETYEIKIAARRTRPVADYVQVIKTRRLVRRTVIIFLYPSIRGGPCTPTHRVDRQHNTAKDAARV